MFSCVAEELADAMHRFRLTGFRPLVVLTVILFWPGLASGEKADDAVRPVAPAQPAERGKAPVRVKVFYVTNRRRHEDRPVADVYSGERGEARSEDDDSFHGQFTVWIPWMARIVPRAVFLGPVHRLG